MIHMDNKLKLVAIYYYISDLYDNVLKYSCQRFSNNNNPGFTDAEIMAIYLYVMTEEKRFKIKEIYEYTKKHLLSWFPKLPGYTAFNKRLNRLSEAFKLLGISLITEFQPDDCCKNISLLDSQCQL